METFNIRHFIFITIGFTALVHKTYVSILVDPLGRDTFIASAIAAVILLVFISYCLRVFKKSGYKEIHEIYVGALGRPIGYLMYAILFGALLVTFVESSGSMASILHANIFLETPIYYYLLISYLCSTFIASKRTSTVITLTILSISLIILVGMCLSFLVYPYRKINFIIPVLRDGMTKDFIYTTIKCCGAYSSFFISFFYFKYIKKTGKIILPVLLGALFTIQMLLFALSGSLATFQIDRLSNMWYSPVLQAQLVSQYKSLESGELFVMTQVVGGWTIRASLVLHIIFQNIEKVYRQKWVTYMISAILYIITYIQAKNLFRWFAFIEKNIYLSFFAYMFMPSLIFIIYDIRHRSNA